MKSLKATALCALFACVVLAGGLNPLSPSNTKRDVGPPWRTSSDTAHDFGPGRGGNRGDPDDFNPDSSPTDPDDAGGSFDQASRGGIAFDRTRANRARTAHGVLAAVIFVGVFPLGAILLRLRAGSVWLHGGLQVVALAGYVAAAGIGIWLAVYVRIPSRDGGGTVNLFQQPSFNYHPIIGLIVLALLLPQPVWGILHHTNFAKLRRRTPWSHIHLWTGRLAVPLGMANGALGLWRSGASRTVLISYSVVAAAVWAIWMVFAVVCEVRRRRPAEVTEVGKGAVTPGGSVVTSAETSVSPHVDGTRRPGP